MNNTASDEEQKGNKKEIRKQAENPKTPSDIFRLVPIYRLQVRGEG